MAKKWIQKATKRMEQKGTKGAFTAYCKKQGYDGVTNECINKALKSSNPTLRKRAAFAKAMRKIKK